VKLGIVAVGKRMPGWVDAGIDEYAKRLPPYWRFKLVEVPAVANGEVEKRKAREGEALLSSSTNTYRVALDERGRCHDTAACAARLEHWQGLGRDVALLIGGADGLHADVLAAADETWSLSALTFPHPLVRVILVEQLYRAQSLLSGHPYHRA